jgi:uncharacterized protein (TIGR00251 family)
MWYQYEQNAWIIHVYVQPGAKKTEVSGLHGDALKIRLASPPIEGRANQALLKYIAHVFDVPLRQVILKKGEKSRYKKLEIIGSSIDPSIFL